MTRLLIIGHTAHYWRNGELVGWGSTVKEINWLAPAFDELVHLACLHKTPAPDSALPYTAQNVRLVAVPPGGGLTLRDKLRVLWLGPRYSWHSLRQIRRADVVHVRCPGSLEMYGMLMASWATGKPKWVKYAGNWGQKPDDPTVNHRPHGSLLAQWRTGRLGFDRERDQLAGPRL